MANPYEVNQQIHNGSLNGVPGKWIPVNPNEVPANGVSNNPMNPTVGADGAYYYAEDVACCGGPTPIGANFNNAIPTPSPVVQLPPIVQPIAMVPYTTQNQPLVQYDPNYRPPVEQTAAPDPVYKPKPYIGISMLVALFAAIAILVGMIIQLLPVFNKMTVFESLEWLFTESSEMNDLIAGNFSGIFMVIVPILYGLIMVFCAIIIINALVHIAKMKPLGKVNGWTVAGLILSIACLVIMLIKNKIFAVGYGAYVILAVMVVLIILPLFINKKVQVLDYVASKQTYVVK